MANQNKRPVFSRARQRSMDRKRLIIIGGAAAALVLVVVLTVLLSRGNAPDRTVSKPADGALQAEGEPLVPLQAEGEPLVSATTAAEATTKPKSKSKSKSKSKATAEPEAANPQRAAARPSPVAEGFMPVFTKANTEEKIVAITVDDCFQAENLKQIVDKAIEVGGKLTIFPIGQNAIKQAQSEILKYAWENGFELENHTYTHNGLFACSNEELAEEVYKQQLALSYILGVNYQCHFLRPRGGDARDDQRMQMYARQLGYYGIAHWSASGSANNTKIAKALEPGAIYLFHTTDKDLEKLLKFIPWVVEQGYQLVTLNEMFGYPANETSELTTPVNEQAIPPLEPYEMVYVPLKKTSYCWEAYLLQEKLIAMGYLTGSPDGVYGDGCVSAIMAYQKDHGMEETGEANADLVRTILEGA